MNLNYVKQIEDILPFIKQISSKTETKALKDMARALVGAINEAGIDYLAYRQDYENDNIFNPDCLLSSNDNLFDFVKPPYKDFASILFELRPVGLGTPNAMVGEGEFMALFCSPRVGISKKKNTGDITVDDKTVELKGEMVRIMGNISGKNVQKHAEALSKKYSIHPNETSKQRTAYEPWGLAGNKENHWQNQFNNLGQKQSIQYLTELLEPVIPIKDYDLSECFTTGVFSASKLQQILLKGLFKQQTKKWDAFTIIRTGGKITSISSDIRVFDKKVDSQEIVITGDYFRSFQDTNVGLYCEHI